MITTEAECARHVESRVRFKEIHAPTRVEELVCAIEGYQRPSERWVRASSKCAYEWLMKAEEIYKLDTL